MLRQPFHLELLTHHVKKLEIGPHMRLEKGVLTINADELTALIQEDGRIASARVEVAAPGEPVRIVHCLDAIEPRVKLKGPGATFPGFLGGPQTTGRGVTIRLAGVSVITSSRFPKPFSGLLAAREAIVDMSGPAMNYSPFSQLLNVVLLLNPQPGLDNADYDDAVRRASLKVADRLARLAIDLTPDETDVFDFSNRDPHLPDIAYFYQIQGQGSMANTYLYGQTVENLVPTLIHPNEIMDGALVSGVFVYACFKNPTYLHLNNPTIWELQARHGKDLNFVGVILNRGHNYTQTEKERSSYWAAKLAGFLEADGVILTAEGGGNSAIDMMLACQYMEKAGIRTTVLSYESPGADGRDFPLFYSVPEADAIVSVGTDEESLSMPQVSRVIGDAMLLDDQTPAAGPFEARIHQLFCATNQLGGNVLAGCQF
jgi:sarcosine reductase